MAEPRRIGLPTQSITASEPLRRRVREAQSPNCCHRLRVDRSFGQGRGAEERGGSGGTVKVQNMAAAAAEVRKEEARGNEGRAGRGGGGQGRRAFREERRGMQGAC
eukprot:758744-Hanusia_phi.AAC.1